MHIVVAGLNYRTCPVEMREKFAFSPDRLPEALQALRQTKSVLEGVIVGTCNRTEIYAVVDRLHLAGRAMKSFLEKWFGIPRDDFADYLYLYEDDVAVEHLFKVTCGLDSMIIGETQILGQVRDAFLTAQKEKATGTIFNTLFKQAVTLAKRAHAQTAINDNPVSVSYAAVELAKQIFGSFANKTVIIIGAGKMGELALKHLTANGVGRVVVINRTLQKAKELAEKTGGLARPFEALEEELPKADIVISSTGAAEFVLMRHQVEKAVNGRRSRPLLLIDIAVPRDLDPRIGELANVFLYNIDDLQAIVDANLEERRREAAKIEVMIREELEAFQHWLKTLGLGPVMQALQQKTNEIYENTMESLLKKLPHLSERDVKVIRKLSKSIVNQILRDPILQMKEMAAERDGEQALRMFVRLFALEEKMQQNQVQQGQNEKNQKEEVEERGAEPFRLSSANMGPQGLIARS